MTSENKKKQIRPSAKGNAELPDNPLKDQIGRSLRRLYDDVVNEPVPDEFLALLAKADQQEEN